MDVLDAAGYISFATFTQLSQQIAPGRSAGDHADQLVATVADLLRYNTLVSVARAGTGHLGASLSMAELVSEVYFRRGQFGPEHTGPDRDYFVLSKGHAAPGLYAALAARGYFATEQLDRLRRWEGLPGHCHTSTPGVDASTGSLAMGLSKAVGLALAKQRFGQAGTVYVLVGDGELQEGQCWEALLSASHFGLANLVVLIDANEVQTDQYVRDILVYHDLPGTLTALGCAVATCAGHDPAQLRTTLDALEQVPHRPRVLIARTIKGRGVGFMEHPRVLDQPHDRYVWHNKPPDRAQLAQALAEITERVKGPLAACGLQLAGPAPEGALPRQPAAVGVRGAALVPAFAQALVACAQANPRVVVLDADLEDDCGLTPFRQAYPERFFELGIMEQHQGSVACALAGQGYWPVVVSYSAFLSSRANEHLYNLASDTGTRFLLVGHLAGVIPATPGLSHQAFRDTGVLRSIPGLWVYQPSTPLDMAAIVTQWAGGEAPGRLYLRIVMAASALPIAAGPVPAVGHARIVRPGTEATMVTAGPVMLGEALAAAALLEAEGLSVAVHDHPWVTAFAPEQLEELVQAGVPIVVAEDHHERGGLGEGLLAALGAWAGQKGRRLPRIDQVALTGLPATGFRDEALAGLGIGRAALAERVRGLVTGQPVQRAA